MALITLAVYNKHVCLNVHMHIMSFLHLCISIFMFVYCVTLHILYMLVLCGIPPGLHVHVSVF